MGFLYVFCKDAIVYSRLICVSVHSIGHVGGQVLCGWRIGVVAVEHARVEGGNVAYSWTPSVDSLHYGAKRRIRFESMLSCEFNETIDPVVPHCEICFVIQRIPRHRFQLGKVTRENYVDFSVL